MNRMILAAVLLLTAAPGFAYVGPGAGIPVLGSLLAVLLTFVLAIGAIVLWPIRKFLKRRQARAASAEARPRNDDDDAG